VGTTFKILCAQDPPLLSTEKGLEFKIGHYDAQVTNSLTP